MKTQAATLALACALGCTRPQPADATFVQTGLDVLVATDFEDLRGRDVGLITNQTGRDARGDSIVDVLSRSQELRLVALFSPEHGFEGALDQARVANATHSSGLTIHSLYGETRKPTGEMLEGVDTLVFDIQDIGTRFYTYMSTMRLAMEAAAEHGLRFVVLDRPNPIGGVAVQGPVLDEGAESFVGTHRIAVRHGMTAGELARMFNDERGIDCDLHVVRMRGWRRAMLFDETGLGWVNPSPNMRNLNQALLYPGIGLVETTNVSVGRGTDQPFELVGAPWIDGRALARRLNADGPAGLRFVPVEFTPESSKFEGQRCSGISILITDRAKVDPLEAGMMLACALRDLFGDAWNLERYQRLLGSRAVFEALRGGADASELQELWQDELSAFRARRARYLSYD